MRKEKLIRVSGCLLALAMLAPTLAVAQIRPKAKPSEPDVQKAADAKKLPAEKGDVLDRVAAIVNGDLVLESDVEEEMRFEALEPFQPEEGRTARERALNRMIDRALILQQQRGMLAAPVPDDEIDRQITDMRRDLPLCANGACKTDAGWKQVLAEHGFTPEELRARWKLRQQVLGFIEQRFRAGVRISETDIETFYKERMIPEYRKRNVSAPPLESLSDRIEELLLQQKVSLLLDDWLKSLRDEGSVRVFKKGEEAP